MQLPATTRAALSARLDSWYDPAAIPVDWDEYESLEASRLQNRPTAEDFWKVGAVRHDPLVFQQAVCRYLALIAFIDEQIGRILAALDEAGLANDTLIIFASHDADRGRDSVFWLGRKRARATLRELAALAGIPTEASVTCAMKRPTVLQEHDADLGMLIARAEADFPMLRPDLGSCIWLGHEMAIDKHYPKQNAEKNRT